MRSQGVIRGLASRRKPAAAVTRHPSSGHAGGNSQPGADGEDTAGLRGLATTRERIHWAGAGIRTVPSMRSIEALADFQRAGAISCTRADSTRAPRTFTAPPTGGLPMPDPGSAMEGERDLARTRLAGTGWHPGDAIATWDVAGRPSIRGCS